MRNYLPAIVNEIAHLHCTERTICHEKLTHFKNRVHTAPVGRRRGVLSGDALLAMTGFMEE